MCGIAGLITRGAPPERALLERMAGRLAHRGPDDRGVHIDGAVGLAHTRLSIIDLAGGHQPLFAEQGRLALVANGEVYNYLELRASLEAEGRRFSTRSDSETILHAYAADPRGFVGRLNGMFAFALHDGRDGRLLLARDRLGIKPLYYAVLPDRVAFASEIKALLPVLPGRPRINPRALVQFLESQFNTGEETIVEGIRRLPPGEIMTVDADLGIARRRYWSALEIAPRQIGYEEAREEFDALMAQVMREHIRSDVPYGLFLSGGVDSGTLAGLLRGYQERPVRSFSVGYREARQRGELDEAEQAARLLGTEHTALLLDRDAVFRRLPHSVWAADDLLRDYACLPTSILAETAARELKVVFTGEGGDEVFAGYGRYRKGPLQRWVKGLLAPGSGGFRTRSQLRRASVRSLYGPALREARPAVRAPFVEAWRSTPRDWSDVQRSQYTDLATNLPDDLLVKADRMLMGFGLEGRVPFLDHRVVEFGLSLPDALKVAPHRGKLFLRRWAGRYLPAEHLAGRKRGFHVPVGEWLQGNFLQHLGRRLQGDPGVREWFRPEGVRRLLAQPRAGSRHAREIWSLLQLAIWHRVFVEGTGERPSPDEDPLEWIG